MPIAEISPTELQQRLSEENPPILIDVREDVEAAICAIEGSILIPMNTLPHACRRSPAIVRSLSTATTVCAR